MSLPARGLACATLVATVVASGMAAGMATAGGKLEPPPPLPLQHTPPSGAFSFRTPEGWTLSATASQPETVEAWGGDLGVRFVFRRGEAGYDSLHADCMLERLAGPMETAPQVKYEYDYVGGMVGDRRALDSAFVVQYDRPVRGHRAWRQRTITVVGGGQSLCAMSYAPVDVWKKSGRPRATLDAVLSSLTFRP